MNINQNKNNQLMNIKQNCKKLWMNKIKQIMNKNKLKNQKIANRN